MADIQSIRQVAHARTPFSAWLGVVLLFALFGVIVLAVIGPWPRGDTYEQKRAKAREEKLKAAREDKGLSLADLTEITGMDRSVLSKLETGQRANPTVETLVRYAEAVGKRLVVSLTDA